MHLACICFSHSDRYLHLECKQIEHRESFGQTIAQNASGVATSNLVRGQQEIEIFESIVHDWRKFCIKTTFAEHWHQEE